MDQQRTDPQASKRTTADQGTHLQDTPWTPNAWVGMDVSKDTLDVCLIGAADVRHSGRFLNQTDGYIKLLKWVARLAPKAQVHFCVEATGAYSRAIALFLIEKGHHVTIANPLRTKYAALAQGQGNKTDKSDAQVIAVWCRDQKPPLWRLTKPQVRELVALSHYLDALINQSVQHKNRLSEPGLIPAVETSLRLLLDQTEQQIQQMEQAIRTLIDDDPDLRQDRDLLLSIPGIGEATAIRLLAEMPDVTEFSCASSLACYAGLTPRVFQSGSSVRKPARLSKQGNGRLRAALFMAALSARQHNVLVRCFCERLLGRGKAKKAVICAGMRKLLLIVYGVLRHRKPFDKNYLPAMAIAA